MKEKNYEIKRIYYLLLGIKESIIHKENYIPQKVVNQYNRLIEELEDICNDSLRTYKVDATEKY